MPDLKPIIVCDNLVKIYKISELEVVALQGLDLTVESGELLGVIGASGSGKSSLLNILGGLDRPSAGRVWVNQKDLLKMSSSDLDVYRRNTVGFVWQQGARNLIPYLNVEENIILPMTLAGQTGKKRYKKAEELLELINLSHRRKHKLSELSGGEQQRVAIAVAIANSPPLLLADEPTGELDSATALMIYQMFRNLNITYKITTIIVSHDPLIANHVDRVISIRDGKLSTETIRQKETNSLESNNLTELSSKQLDHQPNQSSLSPKFEELTVLDSAGRLQIPKDYLKKMNIRSRVKLEVKENGILIIPVDSEQVKESAEEIVDQIIKTNQSRNPFVTFSSWISTRKKRK